MKKTYFLGSNTAEGFFGDFSHLTASKTVVLKGGAGTGKSTLMKKVNEIAEDAGFDTEIYRCSSDVSSLDAVFVPSKNFAVIDGTFPHVTEADVPLLSGFLFNLVDKADYKKIAPYDAEIKRALSLKKQHFNDAYCALKCANVIFEHNKSKIERGFEDEIFGVVSSFFSRLETSHGKRETRFVSAYTDDGFVDFLHADFSGNYKIGIHSEYPEIVVLFITKLASILDAHGVRYTAFRAPYSPNFFDALEVDGVIIADEKRLSPVSETVQIDLAIFADMRAEIDASHSLHDALIDKATSHIRLARLSHASVERIYSPAMDWTDVDNKTDKILCLLFDC